MQISIAVCDDNADILSILTAAIESAFAKQCSSFYIDSYSGVNELSAQISKKIYHIFFLDIDMPEMDGIAFAEQLRGQGSNACIIYISNREERVFDTFKVKPLDFIRKSHFHQEIDDVVKNVLNSIKDNKADKLIIESQGSVISIPVDHIVYIECISKTQNIVLKDKSIPVKYTLHYFEENLAEAGFLKPHKGYLVNFRYINRIGKTNIMLTNSDVIPLSKYRIAEVKEKFLKLISK